MAQFTTDFSDYAPGETPADWRDAWVPGGQELIVVEDASATGGKVLQHRVMEKGRKAWAWSKIAGASEVEILTKLRADHVDARFGVIGRGAYGTDPKSTAGWTCELWAGRNREPSDVEVPQHEQREVLHAISYDPDQEHRRGDPRRPHGAGQTRGSIYYPWRANEWHWVRFQLREVDGLVGMRTRGWLDGQPEPELWHHDNDFTDPVSVGKDGFVGITGQDLVAFHQYDVFSVGTDGDSAPNP